MGDSYISVLGGHGSQHSEGIVPESEVASVIRSSKMYPDAYCKDVTYCVLIHKRH